MGMCCMHMVTRVVTVACKDNMDVQFVWVNKYVNSFDVPVVHVHYKTAYATIRRKGVSKCKQIVPSHPIPSSKTPSSTSFSLPKSSTMT
jgi:hypothetical protein